MAEIQPPVPADASSDDVANGDDVTQPATMEEELADKQGVKRPAEEQLGPDDIKKDDSGEEEEDEEDDEPGEFPKATDDVMAHRTVLAPAPSVDQEYDDDDDDDDEGAGGGARPFKLNPPRLIHGIAKSAPQSDEEDEEDAIKPLLRPSALNHHAKGPEDLEEGLMMRAKGAFDKTKFEGNDLSGATPGTGPAMGTENIPNEEVDMESDESKRTNYFLRLSAGERERDLGFGVFGNFRETNAYRIGFEDQDGRSASGNGVEKEGDSAPHENYFMQFASKRDKDLNSAGDSPSSLSSSSGSSFLFGQNMNERVTSPNRQEGELQSVGELVFGQNLSSRIKVDGFSEISPEKPKEQTLAENANAIEEARQRMRRKFEDVESRTGEEDEENVLQSHCKLFMFDHNKRSWLERGRGQIRLNDKPQLSDTSFQSRLVMRTQGSLRLILNTKIWSGMTIEKASQKSLRLSAMDSETDAIKVFLVTGTPKDIEQLYCAIEYRVQALKHVEEEKQRLETEGLEGAEGGAPKPNDLANDEEDDAEDDEEESDEDEDSEVAKICSRDMSKQTSPKSAAEDSASVSPAPLPEEAI